MKGLLALIALSALASAKPTKDNFYDSEGVLPTQMVKFDNEVFTNKVGQCTMREYTYSTSKCQRAFYQSFRKDKTTPCRRRFQSLVDCYLKELRACYEKILPAKDLKKFMVQFMSAFKDFKKIQCGETGFDIGKYFKQLPKPDECPKGTLAKLGNCAQTWYQLFRINRGSPKLCYRYQKYADCAKAVIDKCTFDFKKSVWIFSKDLNPFCDEKQLHAQN